MPKSTIGDALWSDPKQEEGTTSAEMRVGSWANALSKPVEKPKMLYKDWAEKRAVETGAINAPNDFVFVKGGCKSDKGDFYPKQKLATYMQAGIAKGIDPLTTAAMALKEGASDHNPFQLDIGQHGALLSQYTPVGKDKKGNPIYKPEDLTNAALDYYLLCLKLENGDETKAIERYNGKGETVGEKGKKFHGIPKKDLGKTPETRPGVIHASRVLSIKQFLQRNKEIQELVNGILGKKPKKQGAK